MAKKKKASTSSADPLGSSIMRHAVVGALTAVGAVGGLLLLAGTTRLVRQALPAIGGGQPTPALPGGATQPAVPADVVGQSAYSSVTPNGQTIYY